MGDFNVMDMITRLPITEGDEVIAFCVPKNEPNLLNMGTGFFNDVKMRVAFGKYDGYGNVTHGDIKLFDKNGDEIALFIRARTMDFVTDAYNKRMVNEHEKEQENRILSVYVSSCLNSFVKEMYQKHGWRAVSWAYQREYERVKESASETFLNVVKDWYDYKTLVDKGNFDISHKEEFNMDAWCYVLMFKVLEWFCKQHRISPFMYNFEKYSGQGIQYDDYDRARRFAKFIEGECEAKIEQYRKMMEDEY